MFFSRLPSSSFAQDIAMDLKVGAKAAERTHEALACDSPDAPASTAQACAMDLEVDAEAAKRLDEACGCFVGCQLRCPDVVRTSPGTAKPTWRMPRAPSRPLHLFVCMSQLPRIKFATIARRRLPTAPTRAWRILDNGDGLAGTVSIQSVCC